MPSVAVAARSSRADIGRASLEDVDVDVPEDLGLLRPHDLTQVRHAAMTGFLGHDEPHPVACRHDRRQLLQPIYPLGTLVMREVVIADHAVVDLILRHRQRKGMVSVFEENARAPPAA